MNLKNLDRVNKFLEDSKKEVVPVENQVLMGGLDMMKNIVGMEFNNMAKLESMRTILINIICDPRRIRGKTDKEIESLFKLVENSIKDKRDFFLKMSELSSKSKFMEEFLKQSSQTKETVISENGEIYETLIDEDSRKNLSEILRGIINDRVRS